MSDLIKEIGKLCLHQDPKLSKCLTDSQRALAHRHPDIIGVEQAKIKLKKQIGSVHSSMKEAAKSPKGIKYQQLCGQARAMKLQEEHAALVKTLHDYHSTADFDHMVVQLKEEKPSSQSLASVEHVIQDRN